jgi:uncharacterized membrane protein
MAVFATTILTIAAGTWVGAIIFQSAIVAPAVFVDLDANSARRFLRRLFPRFYWLGVGCGLLMGIAILLLAGLVGPSSSLLAIAAITALMLILELVSLWLVPRINAARDAGEAAAGRFGRLHRVSVILTVIILLLGIAVLSLIGVNAAPRLTS